MKKYLLLVIILSIISTGLGYLGKSFFTDKDSQVVANENTLDFNAINTEEKEEFDYSKESIQIENLSKSYLVASMNFDWETVKQLTTGKYYEELQTSIIQNMDELVKEKKIEYEFNPRSMSITIESLTDKEGVIVVDYVVSKGMDGTKIPMQETIKLFVVKNSNVWKIFSVETKQ